MMLVLLSIVLFGFTFNGSPLTRAVLLVLVSFIVSLWIFKVFSFSWYFLLFVLVYVGGIYVILIYVSMAFPNFSLFSFNLRGWAGFVVLLFLLLGVWSDVSVMDEGLMENSFYLCGVSEVLIYLFLCLVLMISLVFINFIVGFSTSSYFR
ncbi:NADH dehydrogenase subunit 6 (mitochondrion) [Schistosoma mansoni]|uniref:NADH dehydrogenase 6 n=1 Tax=Schistosoma mansoni TaxID=6183 RepID=Q9MD22_SCHMA|nr:NADH dehydrogenase subunit 6 [Schistosoma mansoni]AAF29450.1 NADH dehydrogenase 6 [Schistosoma mansoni]AAF73249.2 NADH dehydrogenase 6 [Schistosoma mansoni]AAG13159.2 NADH dehydrogenase subunit 6 [Schistosoma mansoni]|eukprot:NP_066207.2 NADH dehydrogenase subunit 6 (mitochondrion) [Schistosoma mansoni]